MVSATSRVAAWMRSVYEWPSVRLLVFIVHAVSAVVLASRKVVDAVPETQPAFH